MSLVHAKLAYQVMGCAFAVYNDLGPYYRESIYHRAMEISLDEAGLAWESEVPVNIRFRGRVVGAGKIDIQVESKIVLELKATDRLHPKFESQLIEYLAATEMKLGILLNFGHAGKLQYKRIVL